MSLLRVEDVSVAFGGVEVLRGVGIEAPSGKVTALIGPNGAGKSTLVNVVSGLVEPDAGKVWLDDTELTGMPAFKRARLGLARTFQNLELFEGMTVRENAILGAFRGLRGNPWRSPLRARDDGEDVGAVADRALDRLAISGLAGRSVDELGFAEAKVVEPARLFGADPTALIMDEPGAGLGRAGKEALSGWTRDFAEQGVAIVLIEHDMRLVMELADHIFVLDHGVMIASGPPEQIRRDERVLEAYLGREETAR